MSPILKLGILGAGPVTQAIHLPVLALMPDLFQVATVMDVDAALAGDIAARSCAMATTRADVILDDPAIDVVVVCSPNAFHADQVIAACRAGKRAVLCEKPLGIDRSQAAAIAAAAARSGTQVIVGTMHVFDPAWQRALTAWRENGQDATHIASSIYLPPNGLFVDLATEGAGTTAPPPSAGKPDRAADLATLRNTILGLAIHDLPLLRSLMPEVGEVLAARRLPPFGYSLLLSDGVRTAELNAFMPGAWPPRWALRASSADAVLDVRFPPSYVRAGSADARLTIGDTTRSFRDPVNGYEAQWRHLHAVVTTGATPIAPIGSAIDDLGFALDLADRAVAWMEING